jgi:hypothetical protein
MVHPARRYREMQLISGQQKQTAELVPGVSGDNKKNNGGLTSKVERGLSEVFMFVFSVVLHLSHSLEGEHRAKL